MSRDYVLALTAALGSIASSTWAIKAIIKHEMKQCDLRMEAFREGLSRHDKDN